MKKSTLLYLLGVLLFTGMVGGLKAYNQYEATKWGDVEVDDIKLNGNDILDSNGTTRVSVGSTNTVTGNLAASGSFMVKWSTAPRDVSSSIAITPGGPGALVFNATDNELCVASGTTSKTWVQMSSFQVVACRH